MFLHDPSMWQGCILSPALFCEAINWILGLAASHVRIKVGQEVFTDQDYTNDAALLVEKLENFSSAFQDVVSTMGLNASWHESWSWATRTPGAGGIVYYSEC